MIETIYGIAIIIEHRSWLDEEGYKVRLTENSICPNKIIEFLPKRCTREYKDR